MKSLSTEELVRLCQATLPDDTRAFEEIVRRFQQRVFTLAYRLLGNVSEAEDQAQEVFLKIYRNIKNLDEPVTLSAWITRITTNTCLDALSKQKSRISTLSFDEDSEDDESKIVEYPDLRTLTPEEDALRAEMYSCIERTMAELDTASRAILLLRDVEDLSYQEVADHLKLGLSAVKMRIHRARLAFQQALERVCPGMGHRLRG